MFISHSPSVFQLDLVEDYNMAVIPGRVNVPWRPGLKLTSVSRLRCKSDGTPFDTTWGGIPWVESPLGFNGVASFSDRHDLAFRREAKFVFSGMGRRAGSFRPSTIHFNEEDVWPRPVVGGEGLTISLDHARAGMAATMGVLTHFFDRRAVVSDATFAQLKQLGYHRLDQNTAVPICRDVLGIAFPNADYASDLIGLSNVRIVSALINGGIACGSFQVDQPDLASGLYPWMAHAPRETRFDYSSYSSKNSVRLSYNDIVPEIFCRKSHNVSMGKIITYPSEIKVWPRNLLVECHLMDEPCFIGYPDTLTQCRKLSGLVNNSIIKRRLWIPGSDFSEPGYYYLTSETIGLASVDRKGRMASIKELRQNFPWVTNKHLKFSHSDLALHDKFLKCLPSDGWLSPRNPWRSTTQLFNVAESLLCKDEDVFITSPVTLETVYRPPTYAKLKSAGALDAYMKELAINIPVFSDIMSDPEASRSFLLMMISA